MTMLLKNITKRSSLNQKMPSIITIKEQPISEKNNTKRLKNVLLKPFNLIKNRQSHMHGLLIVKSNLETFKKQNNTMKGHMK